jgi:hypothetical protein
MMQSSTEQSAKTLYLSKRKLDTDFAGVGPGWWLRFLQSLGIGITVSLPFVELKAEPRGAEKPDLEKVYAVWKRLVRTGQVGTIDEPKRWFSGRCILRYQVFKEINPPILYLTGETGSTVIALGGALKHVNWSGEVSPPADTDVALFETDVVRTLAAFHAGEVGRGVTVNDWTTDILEILYHSEGRTLDCEFLAARERYEPNPSFGKKIILGSPLLVTYRG